MLCSECKRVKEPSLYSVCRKCMIEKLDKVNHMRFK